MELEENLVTWLNSVTGLPVHYQHIDRQPAGAFCWFIRNGDEDLDTLDGSGEPDVVYFDLEVYAQTAAAIQSQSKILRAQRDYGGALGDGTVDDISIDDQRDDYEPQAAAESLPPYAAAFRLTISGYAA